jgi:ABC-type nickel/cobalt efflux system permease component RcnA
MTPEFHAHQLGTPELSVLLLSTAGVAVLHTLAGPDHYLPFIVMGRARKWTTLRTVFWTVLCGFGHVGSSVVIALTGVIFGYGLERVQFIESFRGNLAAWALIAFGAVYLAWGLRRAGRVQPHTHAHAHSSGLSHEHRHSHDRRHAHPHGETEGFRLTPWVLFTLFIFGPCETMIPLVMYPAAQGSWHDVWTVVAIFSVLTVGTMLLAVLLALKGLALLPTHRVARYNHAIAGGTLLLAGCAIQFLGL